MTLPQRVYSALLADVPFRTFLGGADDAALTRFYLRGSLGRDGVPAKPECPYAMYGEGAVTPASAVHKTSPTTAGVPYTFYVYDDSGSFERIKDVHRQILRVMLALSGTTTSEGMMVTEVKWTGSSSDALDSVTKNNVKTSTFQVVGKV